MPIHLSSLTKKSDDSSILAEMLMGALDHADAAVVSEDRNYIQMAQFMTDLHTGQRIGKLIYTMFRNEKEKSLNVLDLDITLDSVGTTELEFLEILPGSSDANEYYDVASVNEGQHLQIETVNRNFIKQEIRNTTQAVRVSAFPFRLTVYEDLNDLNRQLGYTELKVKALGKNLAGLHEHFAAPGNIIRGGPFDGEVFSVIVRDVEVCFGNYRIPFVIAQIDSALGLLPTAMGRDVFNLDGLAPGRAIMMYTDIKADFAVEQ